MHATFRNETDQPLPQIVFNVDPNRTPGAFMLTGPGVEGSVPVEKFTLTGPRLEIALKAPLEINCSATFTLHYALKISTLNDARVKYLSFTDRQLNLGYWLPEIAPFLRGEWFTPRSWTVGEYTVSELGDYTVRATVKSTDKLEVIGPGEVERLDADTWQYRQQAARSFTLCLSPAMTKISTSVPNGDKGTLNIDLYTLNDTPPTRAPDGTVINAPKHALETARAAALLYIKLFGALPLRRLVLVDADFPDGMEFSGLVYIGHRWFSSFDGKPDSWLTLITAHEVAHAWWYSLVGNEQAEAPFLDEALALYCELIYLETTNPALVSWWWSFRVRLYQPTGYVDSTIYEFSNSRQYINAVYLRGAQMLQEIRQLLGDVAFFKWWRDYAAAGANRIVTPADFWKALAPADYAKTISIRAKYLLNPDPIKPVSATNGALPTRLANQSR